LCDYYKQIIVARTVLSQQIFRSERRFPTSPGAGVPSTSLKPPAGLLARRILPLPPKSHPPNAETPAPRLFPPGTIMVTGRMPRFSRWARRSAAIVAPIPLSASIHQHLCHRGRAPGGKWTRRPRASEAWAPTTNHHQPLRPMSGRLVARVKAGAAPLRASLRRPPYVSGFERKGSSIDAEPSCSSRFRRPGELTKLTNRGPSKPASGLFSPAIPAASSSREPSPRMAGMGVDARFFTPAPRESFYVRRIRSKKIEGTDPEKKPALYLKTSGVRWPAYRFEIQEGP